MEREQRQELRRVGTAVSGCTEWTRMQVESFLCNGSLFFFHRRLWRSWGPTSQHFQRRHRRRHNHRRLWPAHHNRRAAVVVETDLQFPGGLPPLVELKGRTAWAHLAGETRRRCDGELLTGRVLRGAGETLNHCPEVGGVGLDESGVLGVVQCRRRRRVGGGGAWSCWRVRRRHERRPAME